MIKLEVGMVVETREGKLYLVLPTKLVRERGYFGRKSIDEITLCDSEGYDRFDIVKVWSGNGLINLDLEEYIRSCGTDELLWEREDTVRFGEAMNAMLNGKVVKSKIFEYYYKMVDGIIFGGYNINSEFTSDIDLESAELLGEWVILDDE